MLLYFVTSIKLHWIELDCIGLTILNFPLKAASKRKHKYLVLLCTWSCAETKCDVSKKSRIFTDDKGNSVLLHFGEETFFKREKKEVRDITIKLCFKRSTGHHVKIMFCYELSIIKKPMSKTVFKRWRKEYGKSHQ